MNWMFASALNSFLCLVRLEAMSVCLAFGKSYVDGFGGLDVETKTKNVDFDNQ